LGKKSQDPWKRIHYMGSSMSGTFRPGDLLYVVPYEGEEVRCGDVIVFIPPGRERRVVHRVVSVSPGGIRTQGDNSSKEDPYFLKPEHIIGRVMYAKGRRKWRRVPGGVGGKWRACKLRTVRRLDSRVSSWIVPLLRRLLPVESIRRLVRKRVPLRIIAIDRPNGTEFQLLLGRMILGRLLPGRQNWNLRRTIGLLVGEESLPSEKNAREKSRVAPTLQPERPSAR